MTVRPPRFLTLVFALLCVVGWMPRGTPASTATAEVEWGHGPGILPGHVEQRDAVEDPSESVDTSGPLPPRPRTTAPSSSRALLARPHARRSRSQRVEPGQPRGPPSFVVS